MHVLEIFFLLLREQSPCNLAKAGESMSIREREKDEDKIDELLTRERQARKQSKCIQQTRHTNFGGSFTVTNQKMLSGNSRVYHRPLSGIDDYSFDIEKKPLRTPLPKRRLPNLSRSRLSAYSIRLVLKQLCIQLLDYCFNVLMRVVKDTIKRQRSMDNDETYYLWAIKFFMEFNRLNNFRVDIVSESLQLSTVHQILQLIANYYEHVFMNKRDKPIAIQWGERLHYAVQAYKELLLYIQEMTRSDDTNIVRSSKVILSNLLYHSEYRDVFLTLLRNFNEAFLPLNFLQDVVHMTHIYIRLVDIYAKQNGRIIIQKKRKASKKKTNEKQMSDMWSEVEKEIRDLIEDENAENYESSFSLDSVSDLPVEEQKFEVLKQIHVDISQKRLTNVVALLRAARELWPDDVFGSDSATVDEDMVTLQDIALNPSLSGPAGDEEDDEPHEEESVNVVELELDLKKFTSMFASNKIVRVYSMLLENYRANPDEINHAIVKMFHIIGFKHEMLPMLYHITLFQTFSKILNEPPLPRLNELKKFCSVVVAQFFKLARHNHMAFPELLIWKTSGDCYELKEGYGALQQRKENQKNRSVWTREQEEELARLFEQYKDDNDIVGCILAALPSNHFRTRRIVSSQLLSQGLVGNRKDLHKKKAPLKKAEWTEEEIFTLQSLWQPSDDVDEAIHQLMCYFPGICR
jgi:timeless